MWTVRYPKDYNSAYMHLSTPALFAPYVRLELLRWDPLYADGGLSSPAAPAAAGASSGEVGVRAGLGSSPGGVGSEDPREGEVPGTTVHKGFDQQQWYEALFDYGVGAGGASAMAEDDPDAELVPQLVRKLVLPVALSMLQR